MRVIEAFAKQHPKTLLGTDFGMMHSLETYEATIHCKEKIGIGTHQVRKCIKSSTIHRDENRGRETRLGEELNLVNVVVIGHIH
jgi:hypothetical protein